MRPRLLLSARALALVSSAAAILGVLACRQLVGITDNPPEDLVTSICGLPYGTNVCASCVSASCCAESMICADDPACAAYEGCLGKCNGDPACRSQCTIYPVSTASDVSALSACLASKCEAACGLTCGGIANLISEPPSATSCQSCIEETTSVCAHARAWGTSVGGDAYWRCVLACPTEDCRATCATDNDAGAATFGSFQADYAGSCSGPCAYGGYWACVGHVNWPLPKSPTVKLTSPVIDYATKQGVSGLDVQICGGCPCGAATPILVQGQTDEAGVYSLDVPQVLGPTGVGLDGVVQITSPTMSIVPACEYWGYPLSEPTASYATISAASFAAQVITPAEFAQDQTITGLAQNPSLGYVGVEVHDCLGSTAPGVEVMANPAGSGVYYGPGETIVTSSSGQVFMYNFPPGVVTLTATPMVLGKAVSTISPYLTAGTITAVQMFPTPTQ